METGVIRMSFTQVHAQKKKLLKVTVILFSNVSLIRIGSH